MNPEQLHFTKTHEWVAVDGDTATMGVSEFAVKLLTDIVFLALPKTGRIVRQAEPIGEIERVKAVSDLYAPIAGQITEVNNELPDQLALLSESPYEKAWICKIKMSDPGQVGQLLNHAEYVQHCENAQH